MTPEDSTNQEDRLTFQPELPTSDETATAPPWKVMIVDDESGVHAATRLALRDISFRGRRLQFISAFSAAEALEKLRQNEDTAMIFLDVVMETEDAGLLATRQIREAGFKLVRIVLRTGHPGHAPEREIVVNYDIHDYKEKSTLDFWKLFSCLISALRSYDDLATIERHRRGLWTVVEEVACFDAEALQRYLSRLLTELSSLAGSDFDDLLLIGLSAEPDRSSVPAWGEFERLVDRLSSPLTPGESELIQRSIIERKTVRESNDASLYRRHAGIAMVLFIRRKSLAVQADPVLLDLFLNKAAQATEKQRSFSEILSERDSLIRNFAEASGLWSGHHSSEYATMQVLARATAARLQKDPRFTGLIDDWFVFSIGSACGFHDLGVQGLPHHLFEKKAPLSDEERVKVHRHVQHGAILLRKKLADMQHTSLFRMAERIILQHHERHDGSGYPLGLVGDAIALPARIVAVVDTFVAMTSPRAHRPAHSPTEALAHLISGRGSLFDPLVVDAFAEALASERQIQPIRAEPLKDIPDANAA